MLGPKGANSIDLKSRGKTLPKTGANSQAMILSSQYSSLSSLYVWTFQFDNRDHTEANSKAKTRAYKKSIESPPKDPTYETLKDLLE